MSVFQLRPAPFDPALNGLVVAFGRSPSRSLPAPVQAMPQDGPDARWVELELAATGSASDRTQRRGDSALGQTALASVEKRARRQNALIVFEDESGVSLLPSVRATWAPRGCTPVLRHRFNWKRLSLAGALAYEPDGSAAHLVFELRPGAYNDETLIEFLSELNDFEQRRVVLIMG